MAAVNGLFLNCVKTYPPSHPEGHRSQHQWIISNFHEESIRTNADYQIVGHTRGDCVVSLDAASLGLSSSGGFSQGILLGSIVLVRCHRTRPP